VLAWREPVEITILAIGLIALLHAALITAG
jgi:hypothetical protein